MSAPRLLHFRVSHYNEKVRWALDHKSWPHVREAQIAGWHIPRVRWLSGQNKIPVLILDGEVLAGSSHILAELERRRPEPALFPEDPAELERAREIERYFDEEVAPELRRLFWSTYVGDAAKCAEMATAGFSSATRALWQGSFPILRPLFTRNMGLDAASLERAHARLASHFDRLESEIGPHGYLVGDRFGLADLAAASVMTAILRPPEFPYPLPEPWPEALAALRDSVARREGARWTYAIYAKHRGASAEIAAEPRDPG